MLIIAIPSALGTSCDPVSQFTCADVGNCIAISKACDVTPDCGEGSDEGENYCCK